MAGVTSFIGRALFALLFLGSGVQKLQSLDFKSGGPVLDVLSPKLDEVFSQFQSQTGYSVPVQKVSALLHFCGHSIKHTCFYSLWSGATAAVG